MRSSFVFFLLVWCCSPAFSQKSSQLLKQQIEDRLASKKAVVGVAMQYKNEKISVNGKRHFPMQSVFKCPIGLFMMAEIDKGKFQLNQPIEIKKEDLLTPDIYSPIRDTYPNGTTLTIAQILEYTVSMSDNVGCDMLLKLLGGPSSVEKYFHEKGFKDISIKINEETMQSDWNSQFQNWTTPLEANKILKAFYENKNAYLSPESHQFIWNILKNTSTGAHRLKGLLPAGTTVAHKTGWSGQNKQTGITAAVNNIGIIFLPNGEPLYISVFVTESIEDFDANERIIAEIAEMAWNYYTKM